MQVGDKIKCKKKYLLAGETILSKNKFYEILDETPSTFLIKCNEHFHLQSVHFSKIEDGFWGFIEEYFQTDKELRKEKLGKLNDKV